MSLSVGEWQGYFERLCEQGRAVRAEHRRLRSLDRLGEVVYANSARDADLALFTKAALAAELGLEVSVCGTKADGSAF